MPGPLKREHCAMPEPSVVSTDSIIHLPSATENDQDELVDHLLRMAERLPEVTIKVSTKSLGTKWHTTQISPHIPTALVVPLVEMIFDTDGAALIDVELHAQFVFLSALATVPESMAMQIAFGRRTGEEIARKFAGLVAQADHRGITADALVAELDAADAIPKDRTYLSRRESSQT